MKHIASILEDLSLSQNSYHMIKTFNQLSSNEYNTCCFYHNLSVPPNQPLFATMNIYYLNHFYGHAISTSLETAETLLNIKTSIKKYLYLWDLEFIRLPYDFIETITILGNPELNLIARSEDHALLIENYTNRKVKYLLDDWNPNQLLEIVNG